ncbi:hypothetical protein F5I97DRAFT_1894632 [Phlebopus sp. FC_14]|nr:hypothetical protein F5I97DRAFT_1894632 [Phlebopus sp. FC_14]
MPQPRPSDPAIQNPFCDGPTTPAQSQWGPSSSLNMHTFAATLRNPYAHLHASYNNMSPHYYQAYMQASSHRPATTAEGYSLSSTYVPGRQTSRAPRAHNLPTTSPDPPLAQQTIVKRPKTPLTYGSWYQPGNSRCTRQGCPFVGSHKSVEIHMMDRHLIYPSGWEKRKKNDWDADPSLRGKPIAIQGTSLVLDTQEAIDGWIAERKKQFPTAEKIEHKKRKLDEAAARGQLGPEDIGVGARKRRKYTNVKENVTGRHPGAFVRRGRSSWTLRGRERFGRRDIPQDERRDRSAVQELDAAAGGDHSTGADSDADSSPEVSSSKVPVKCMEPSSTSDHAVPSSPKRANRSHPAQPKKLPWNPFASRPTLLRNLLLPEIRITVSNLSQAVRFLVDNDFLRDVELRPGQEMIQVIRSTEANDTIRS